MLVPWAQDILDAIDRGEIKTEEYEKAANVMLWIPLEDDDDDFDDDFEDEDDLDF